MRRLVVIAFTVAAVLTGEVAPSCVPGHVAGHQGSHAPVQAADGIEQLDVKVLEVLPHDVGAFTQGLELAGGKLYESTGVVGESAILAGPPGGRPEAREELPAPLFGEGIAVLGDTLWQLTWRNHVAIERDAKSLAELRRVRYPEEGWGLCHQNRRRRLVSSDGSARLVFRDPRSLVETGEVTVTADGRPVPRLNELECVGDTVYANIWASERIVRIDSRTGTVTGEIDASGLLTDREKRRADVLNGIAAVSGTDQFLITGKLWPKMFRVTFVRAS
ncbi:glutaminyl-peptide cyclotransferase [Streptomyces sp. GC420]|uniref:glutaminyl-peptide cyclotransferase n=1 Tax=Streptomyces sp. GC420 TaxID=2697568 RepID=UPI001414D0E7|nr:glutaminyl-peptide cyclotransferase [Streptomyces sp. GC420]NBM17009.1 glutaminyl-peptide cyclotransferase [Streptomyces sp. GC420]